MSSSVNPNIEFAVVFNNFLLQTNKIIAFRNDVLFLIENGKEQLISKAKQTIQAVKDFTNTAEATIKVTPQFEKMLGESLEAFYLVQNPDSAIRHSRRRIDAAAIVFVHSLLDETIYSLCKISYLIGPNDWLQFIKGRKIKFEDILDKGSEQIVQDICGNFVITEVERKSIIERSDMLHAICSPVSTINYVSNFVFSKSALESFNKLRRDIVHGQQAGREIFNIEQDLQFGLKAGLYFCSMVRDKYGLQKEISEQQYKQLVAEK